jgi:hypothetical protein
MLRLGGHARPAARDPLPVCVRIALGRGDDAVLATRALDVAGPVERRDHVRGEPPGLADHGGGGVPVEIAEQALRDGFVEAGDMAQGIENIVYGGAVHGRVLWPSWREATPRRAWLLPS